jgi:hypothetical protein
MMHGMLYTKLLSICEFYMTLSLSRSLFLSVLLSLSLSFCLSFYLYLFFLSFFLLISDDDVIIHGMAFLNQSVYVG